MNGTSSLKTASKAFLTKLELTWLEALLLLGTGALAVILHRGFDYSLGLPGHHGIEWMALLVISRSFSRFRGAGSLASLGAGLTALLPGLRGGDPFGPFLYLLPGPVLDLAFRYLPRYADKLWFLMFFAGLAHMTKPVARLIITVASGWSFGSFRFGVVYPTFSHFFYGLIGGLLGALFVLGLRKISKSKEG